MEGNAEAIERLAHRLVSLETPKARVEDVGLAPAIEVCQKLRQPLVAFTGPDGFRSLLSRAVTLARARSPLLAALRVNPQGAIDIPNGASVETKGDAAYRAGTQLVGEFLGLLATFIGLPMTLRLVRSTWPGVADDFLNREDQ